MPDWVGQRVEDAVPGTVALFTHQKPPRLLVE